MFRAIIPNNIGEVNNKGFEINVDVQADGQFLDVTTGKVFKTKKELF